MSWLQLTLESDSESAEKLSELLEQFAAVSVSLSAVSDGKKFGQATKKIHFAGSKHVSSPYFTKILILIHFSFACAIVLVQTG